MEAALGMLMARQIKERAALKDHKLSAWQVDGTRPVTSQAQFDSTMRYLDRMPDRDEAAAAQPTGAEQYFAGRAASSVEYQEALETAQAELARPKVIADIEAGFYATPCRTGNNDLDFWKVRVSGKGYRSVARVIGGGDAKSPRLVEITNPEQRKALGAILRAGIDEAANTYADNEQRCKRCGSHLTDDESRAARMGPVCRGDR